MSDAPQKPQPGPAADPRGDLAVVLRCTYCKAPLAVQETVYCAACVTPHHHDCFTKEHGHCAAPGCDETRFVRAEARPAEQPERRGLLVAGLAALMVAGLVAGLLAARPQATSAELAQPVVQQAAVSEPAEVEAAPADALLTVSVTPERDAVFDVSQPLYAVVDVQASAPLEHNDTAVELALVVDRSASMSDRGKIEFARLAVQAILEGLREGDACTVIGFSSEAEELIPWVEGGEAAQAAQTRLVNLTPSGGTNLMEGIELGQAALAERPQREGLLRRLVVLSDGQPTQGETEPRLFRELARGLAEQQLTLSCQAFGGDADTGLLTELAELGGGSFAYVDQGELAVKAFELELAQALGTVATRTEVVLTPLPGFEIAEVLAYTAEPAGDGTRVILGDLTAGSRRKVVVRLEPAAGQPLPELIPAAQALLTADWRAVAVHDGEAHDGQAQALITLAADAAASQASINPELETQLATARFAAELEEAISYQKRGDDDRATALMLGARERLVATLGEQAYQAEASRLLNTTSLGTSRAGRAYLQYGAAPESSDLQGVANAARGAGR